MKPGNQHLNWPSLLVPVLILSLVTLLPEHALASTGGGTGLEWEAPLTKFTDSLKGPVALSLSMLGILVLGGTLIFGGEINDFVRKLVMVILVISTLAFAGGILTHLFGVGALIG